MKRARGDETQIERRRRRRDHAERVLHGHEEQETRSEDAREPMESRHVEDIIHRPGHETGLGIDDVSLLFHSHEIRAVGLGAPVLEGEEGDGGGGGGGGG